MKNYVGVQFTSNLNDYGHVYKVIYQIETGLILIENQSYKGQSDYNNTEAIEIFEMHLNCGDYSLTPAAPKSREGWTVDPEDNTRVIRVEDLEYLGGGSGKMVTEIANCKNGTNKTRARRARLIANAPDLLQTLQNIQDDLLIFGKVNPTTKQQLDEILYKAKA